MSEKAYKLMSFTIRAVICFVFVIIFTVCILGLMPRNSVNIQSSSPLKAYIYSQHDTVRSVILKLLPIGSNKSKVTDFIRNNFIDTSQDSHLDYLLPVSNSYASRYGVEFNYIYHPFAGIDQTVVFFVYDEKENLSNVIVLTDSGYL